MKKTKNLKEKVYIPEEDKFVEVIRVSKILDLVDEFDIDEELKDFEGKRTEFVKLGMELFKSKLIKKIGEKNEKM